jgi:AcrR family transcriptional regulator
VRSCRIVAKENARGRASRQRIAESMLELLRQGSHPTVRDIAEQAGLSERSVYHHFTERDRVLEVAAELQVERVLSLVRPVPVDLPLGDRIGQFVHGRARVLEDITPVRRAAMLVEGSAPRLRELRDGVLDAARRQVEATFAAELDAFAPPVRRRRVAALDAATTWVTWEHLRTSSGLSVADAEAVVCEAIRALLLPS